MAAPKENAFVFLPSDLAPSDAAEVFDTLLSRMRGRKKVVVELGEEAPVPSAIALQMLAATAKAARPPAGFGPRAEAVLRGLEEMRIVETTSS